MTPAPSDIADIFRSESQSLLIFISFPFRVFDRFRFHCGLESADLRCLPAPVTAFLRGAGVVSSFRPQWEILLRAPKIPALVRFSRTGIKSRRPQS
jgi:hypothetical protein